MFVPTSSRPRMAERPESRPTPFIPMVYERVDPTPPRWEYHVLTIDTREQELPNKEQLNELGEKGWVLAGLLEQDPKVHFYFARQSEK